VPDLLLAGSAWWVPLAIALVAASVSYFVTWRFKRADIVRENAFRVADLIVEAEREVLDAVLLADASRPTREKAIRTRRPTDCPDLDRHLEAAQVLLREALVRAQPLGDDDLYDRLESADWFIYLTRQSWAGDELIAEWGIEPQELWQRAEAPLRNVRDALVPHLAPPKLLGRRRAAFRSFPTGDELRQMGDSTDFIAALSEWERQRQIWTRGIYAP
jgi:hypothetical protein